MGRRRGTGRGGGSAVRGGRGGRSNQSQPPPEEEIPSSGDETEGMEVDSNDESGSGDGDGQEEEDTGTGAVDPDSEDSSDEGQEEEPAPGPSHRAPAQEFAIDSSDPIISTLRTSMENTIQFVKDILPFCDTEEKRNPVIDRVQKLMLGYIRTETSYIQGERIIWKLGEELPSLPDESTEQEIINNAETFARNALAKVNENRTTKIREDGLKKHKNYTRLLNEIKSQLSKIQRSQKSRNSGGSGRTSVEEEEDEESEDEENGSVANLEDSDGEDGGEMIPTIDPISKQPLTDPVRNKICRHIYGRAAIMELIRTRGAKIRCTTAGCPNKQHVKANHLVEDPDLAEKVARKLAESNSKRRGRGRRGGGNTTEEEL